MTVAQIPDLKGIFPEAVDLLKAAGVQSLSDLATREPDDLTDELAKADEHFEILTVDLEEELVESWIKEARQLTQETQATLEQMKDVLVATPVPREDIVKNSISVSDVPPMIEFFDYEKFLHEVESTRSPVREARPALQEESSPEAVLDSESSTSAPGRSSEIPALPREIEPLKRTEGIDLRKTASAKLNEGRTPHSRRFIRGVLNPQPLRVKMGAFISLMTLLLGPASLITGVFIVLGESPWLLLIPAVFLVFLAFYFTVAFPQKCRICGQPLFRPKACHRHVKAHRIVLMGYILPTSLHIWLFSWFRCMYCGTAVRLKE